MSVDTDRNDAAIASEDIEEAARVRLQHSHYAAIRRVSCRFEDGTLELHGRVPTYHYKQLAQTAVAGIQGVTRIDNLVEVADA